MLQQYMATIAALAARQQELTRRIDELRAEMAGSRDADSARKAVEELGGKMEAGMAKAVRDSAARERQALEDKVVKSVSAVSEDMASAHARLRDELSRAVERLDALVARADQTEYAATAIESRIASVEAQLVSMQARISDMCSEE
jgi:chromosome segregation ATPase